jgi:hypothetical protein
VARPAPLSSLFPMDIEEAASDPVNEVLPAPKLATLGLEHVLVMYAGAVAVPLIIGGALSGQPSRSRHCSSRLRESAWPASNEAADMLSELHFCWLVHRALAGQRSCARPEGSGEEGADATTVAQVDSVTCRRHRRSPYFGSVEGTSCHVNPAYEPSRYEMPQMSAGVSTRRPRGRQHSPWRT